MEVIQAIKDRRSIRSFKSLEIYKKDITDILNCGRLAPSAKNRQPWYFVVASGKIKNEIANLMINFVQECKEDMERKIYNYPSSVEETAEIIKEAPILILVFKEKNDNWLIGDNLSIGACTENMCLRAQELGLGTLIIRDTVYVAENIAKLVNHDDLELSCCLALGYARECPQSRPRKELDEKVDWLI